MAWKYRYYRVWQGDSNDRREITNALFKGRKGCYKAKDIDHAIAQVYQVYIGAEFKHLWKDTGLGDDTIAVLECSDYEHSEDCPMHEGQDGDCDCEPLIPYIQIEEVDQ